MRKIYFCLILINLLFIKFALSVNATTYYVSDSGNNSKSGTSVANAWASITKVNSFNFLPGDKILFEGGSSFTGSLYFDSNDKSSTSAPIIVGSYGNGKATINSNTTYGIYLYNIANFILKNLKVTGSGRTSNLDSGISFYNDIENKYLDNITIDSVEVYGYKEAGIVFGSDIQSNGYNNFRITNSLVHDNGNVGIASYSAGGLSHKNVYIAHTKVYNNSGISTRTNTHSGNGIMLSGIDGALVEYCEAYNNGWLNGHEGGGPVGIWGYICNNLVIQHSESHHNKTGTTKDGGGFDLDGGCTNSIMQYNYSHDNDGAGYLLAQYGDAPVMKNNIIRYNISENDGRKNSNAGILLWATSSNGGIQNSEIYNNTIYLSPAISGSPTGIFVSSSFISNAKIRNNIIQTTGGLHAVRAVANTGVRFEGNAYWDTNNNLKIYWLGSIHTSINAWREATNQEKLNNLPVGLQVDPKLKDPGKGIIVGDPRQLASLVGYQLQATSGLIGEGLDLANDFGLDVGNQDFWKNNISNQATFNIGAHQRVDVQPTKSAQTILFLPIADKTYGTAPFALTASASSGLDVQYRVVSGPANLASNVLTLTGAGTVVIEATQTGNETYAAAPAIRQSFTVSKATQQITFSPLEDKILTEDPFTLNAITSSGLTVTFVVKSGPATIMGDMVTLTGVGTVIIEARQSGSDLYLPAPSITQSFTVSTLIQNQTIHFPAISAKVYGEEISLSASATSGLPVTFKITAGPAEFIDDNSLKTIGTGTVTIEATQNGNEEYTAATAVIRTFSVNQAPQILTFNPLSNKTYGDAPFTLTSNSSSGLPVSFTVVSGPATVTGNLVTLTGAGLVTIRVNQAGNINFASATAIDRSFTVDKAVQTISFASLSDKVLGDGSWALTATATSGLPVSFSIVSGPATLAGNSISLTGIGTVVVRATQSGDVNHAVAPAVERTFQVLTTPKQGQNITFTAIPNKTFTNEPFTITAIASSGLPVSFNVLSGPATILGNTVTLIGAGTVVIEASQNGNDTYSAAAAVTRTFSINKATQTITFAALANKTYGDEPFALQATATSGEPVSFTLVSGPAKLDGNMLTLTGVGIVVVRVSQAGNETYLPAAQIDRTFSVGKAQQTIVFAPITNKTYGDKPFNLDGTASSGLAIAFRVKSGPATLTGKTLSIVGAGLVTVEATQSGNATFAAAPVVEQSFTVGKTTQVITFEELKNVNVGDAPFALQASSTNAAVAITFSSSNPKIISVAYTYGKWMATVLAAGQVQITAAQAGTDKYLAATNVVRSISVQQTDVPVTDVPEPKEEKLKIVALKASNSSGMDYSPWLNDDLSDLIEQVWRPNNNKYVDVKLQLEYKSLVHKLSFYDLGEIFTSNPTEIYAVNGKEKTFLGVFKGTDSKTWINLNLKEPITAEAIIIRKYGNHIPQKINVYGKVLPVTEQISLPVTAEQKAPTSFLWTAYPNPTAGQLKVEVSAALEGEITIDLLNATGYKLQHFTLQKSLTGASQMIPMDNLKNGMYFLHLKAKGVWEVKKIQKQ